MSLTSYQKGKVGKPTTPFVQLTAELLISDAWRAQSINCRRFVEFLMIEHMNHGGAENGNLMAPWNQLMKAGITRRLIRETISEAMSLGLVEERPGPRRNQYTTTATRYRLTFLAERIKNDFGQWYYGAPTNEWRQYRKATESSFQVYEEEPNEYPIGNYAGSSSGTSSAPRGRKPLKNRGPDAAVPVPDREPLYISCPAIGSPAAERRAEGARGAERPKEPPPKISKPLLRPSSFFEEMKDVWRNVCGDSAGGNADDEKRFLKLCGNDINAWRRVCERAAASPRQRYDRNLMRWALRPHNLRQLIDSPGML